MAGIKASAESRIDFSIIEDAAEVLLLIYLLLVIVLYHQID
jgi:hypothetical protein